MEDYESVLCVKNECFIYKIPPRTSNRGYRYPATFFEYIFRVNLNQDHYRRIRQIFSVGKFARHLDFFRFLSCLSIES